ncbi:lipocalin family protein [Streptomyces sp. NPDC056132]|uniref:lipocalin family protein n=1 Tax=Streptomyces sp. NPDC056132 TaxID=3345722 RepID=UPI0035DDDB2A
MREAGPPCGSAAAPDASNSRLHVNSSVSARPGSTSTPPTTSVVGLHTDCRWAAVTDSGRHGGFVLFRPPALDPTDITAARATLSATGIDPCTVRYTPQGGANAITAPVPVCDRCWRGGHARNA